MRAGFIQTFGQRAYRSPLDDDEITRLYAVFVAGRAEDFRTGVELAAPDDPPVFTVPLSRGVRRRNRCRWCQLTSWEMASRLSYLFWNSMPDDELMLAAKADELRTKSKSSAKLRACSPIQRRTSQSPIFTASGWASTASTASPRAPAVYPAWNENVRAAMRTETKMFLDDVMWNGSGRPPDAAFGVPTRS